MNKMRLIVGLGNFGREYEGTYHNVGFDAVETAVVRLGGSCKKKECKSLTLHALIDGNKVIFAKPQTYMNLSGDAVQELAHKYKIAHEDILVVCDDIDLPEGALRFRTHGSGGTHNGMRHIVTMIGEDFCRLRIGIGRPPLAMDLAAYVLSRVGGGQGEAVKKAVERAAQTLIDFGAGDSAERIGASANVKANQ